MDCVKELTECISTLDPCSQIGIGAAAGFLTCFLLMKIGKIAAIVVGSTLLLVELAHAGGLIKIDWPKVAKNVENYKSRAPSNSTVTLANMDKYTKKIRYFTVAFIGGSFIGFGCS